MRPGICRYIAVIVFLSGICSFAQTKEISISGFITDAKTGGVLVGANILLYSDSAAIGKPPARGTTSNTFGYYKIPNLKSTVYFIVFRSLGYKIATREISLNGNVSSVKLNIKLEPENIKMQQIIVEDKRYENPGISTIEVSPQTLAKLPSMSGQADVFKLLELLPGVNKASDLSSGLYVRGGSPDQTLTLVDNILFYNPAHLGNIASTFNSDALRDIKLIKGAFPAEYGGRLSSVLDIKLRSGTKETETGSLGLGFINSFMVLEGPLKANATYIISGRWMYYDMIQNQFYKSSSAPRYNFYDVNCKITDNLSETSSYSISAIFNRDHAYSPAADEVVYDIDWKNLCLSFNWLQITSGSAFLNSTISVINYQFASRIGKGTASTNSSSYYSNPDLTDINLKESVEINWHSGQKFKSGVEMVLHHYALVYSDYYDDKLETDPNATLNMNALEGALYMQNESEFFQSLTTNIGGRLYYFSDKKLIRFEPRISATWQFFPNVYFNAAASYANQFLHLIVRNDISLPTDLWYPSTKNIEPSNSTQYVAGLAADINDGEYHSSVEGYFRDMRNLYEFKNSVVLNPLAKDLEDQLTKGKGEAYGVEFLLQKNKGKLTGWIGYTLSWTKRQFAELNNGEFFYPRHDRRHDIGAAAVYSFTDNLNIGLTWSYATGQRYTLPNGQYLFDEVGTGQTGKLYLNSPAMNTAMYPAYHKLDITGGYTFNWNGHEMQVYLNFYNVYNRSNPFAQFLVADKNESGQEIFKLKRLNLFPFIPSAGIRVKF